MTPLRHPWITLDALLAQRAAVDGDCLAFAHGKERMTFGELFEAARDYAAGLAGLGVTQGDRIALLLPAGLEVVRAFWGIQLLGGISSSFNPFVPAETAIRRVQRIRPRLVIAEATNTALMAEALRAGVQCVASDGVPRAGASVPEPVNDPNRIAYLQSTSGTSGEPRAAIILHRNAVATLQGASDASGIGRSDVVVCWAPPWHDLGLFSGLLRAPFSATPCHLVTPAVRTIPEWFETVSRVRATMTGAPDFAFRLALRLVDPARVDLSSLRIITNGGEPVRWRTVEAFKKTFGILMSPGYGLAEAGLGVTSNRPGDPVRVDARGNVSCGRSMPGVEVRIAGDGEILVRGEGVFAGYFEAEEATRETLRDGWLHTGDLGQLVDGHLYVLGRTRTMIKRGGAVIAPRELEEAAQEVEEVTVAAAVGVASPASLTEEVVLVVELDRNSSRSAEECGSSVARAVERTVGFTPDRVVVVPQRVIPRTNNGKIRHAVLRTQLQDGQIRSQAIAVIGQPL